MIHTNDLRTLLLDNVVVVVVVIVERNNGVNDDVNKMLTLDTTATISTGEMLNFILLYSLYLLFEWFGSCVVNGLMGW